MSRQLAPDVFFTYSEDGSGVIMFSGRTPFYATVRTLVSIGRARSDIAHQLPPRSQPVEVDDDSDSGDGIDILSNIVGFFSGTGRRDVPPDNERGDELTEHSPRECSRDRGSSTIRKRGAGASAHAGDAATYVVDMSQIHCDDPKSSYTAWYTTREVSLWDVHTCAYALIESEFGLETAIRSGALVLGHSPGDAIDAWRAEKSDRVLKFTTAIRSIAELVTTNTDTLGSDHVQQTPRGRPSARKRARTDSASPVTNAQSS